MPLQPLLLPQADLLFDSAFLSAAEASTLLAQLTADIAWEQRAIRMFGQQISQPRLTAWYGDPAARYTYSGLAWEPQPWTPALLALRQRVEAATDTQFNSVLLNYYRDGRDSVAWHRDRLGVSGDAAVSIVSTGAPRPFLLRPRGGGASRAFLVGHGDLLTMGGLANEGWEHSVPKVAHAGPRISVVFRHDSDGPRGDVTSDHPSRARSSRDRDAAAKAQRQAERRVWESVSSTTT